MHTENASSTRPYVHLLYLSLLMAGVLFIYHQTLDHNFIEFDDQGYVFRNPTVLNGLTWENIEWAMTSYDMGNYHPLTWVSYLVDITLYGPIPGLFAFENTFIHGINALLLYLFIFRLLGGNKGAAFVITAAFAWHPVNVESVAWISQRKSVLAMFFGLCAFLSYFDWAETEKRRHLVTSYVSLFLSLLCKPMLVTFVPIALLLDLWPLNRWHLKTNTPTRWPPIPTISHWYDFTTYNRKLFIEKIPYIICILGFCLLTISAQKQGGAVLSMETHGPWQRICNCCTAYTSYVCNFILPKDLALLYPLKTSIPLYQTIPCIIGIIGSTLLAIKYFGKHPILCLGWLWFIITFIPMIGIVHVGRQAMADRYMYLPITGLSLAAFAIWKEIVGLQRPVLKLGVICSLSLWLSFCTYTARKQCYLWRNSFGIAGHSLGIVGKDHTILSIIGSAFFIHTKNYKEAIRFFELSLQEYDDMPFARVALSLAYAIDGSPAKALQTARQALHRAPLNADVRFNYYFILTQYKLEKEAEIQRLMLLKLNKELNAEKLAVLLRDAQEGKWWAPLQASPIQVHEATNTPAN